METGNDAEYTPAFNGVEDDSKAPTVGFTLDESAGRRIEEDGEGDQEDLIKKDPEAAIADMAGENSSSTFRFKLSLNVQAEDGLTLPHSIPIACGECFGDRIEEIIRRAICSTSFKKRLRAVVGEPSAAVKDAPSDQHVLELF